MGAPSPTRVSLVCRSGARAGARFPLREDVTRVGRGPDNDAIVDGPDAVTVSLNHCEILRDGDGFRVRDLGSTNGTWLDGQRVTEADLPLSGVLRLGQQGPEFALVAQDAAAAPLDRTIEIPLPAELRAATHDELLSDAVHRARHMRAHGVGGQTLTIMRDVLEQALRHSRRRHRAAGYLLLALLLTVSGIGIWRVSVLKSEKRAIDAHIRDLEAALQTSREKSETDQLISRLSAYQDEAESLQKSPFYRFGPRQEDDFVTRELRALMAEFGAEAYAIPPEFLERVNYYLEQDRDTERPQFERALGEAKSRVDTIRRILRDEHMPPDLAYIPIVESALTSGAESAAGAAGPWQLTAATARAYDLRVDGRVDERQDLVKSTRASCRYLKDLILDFGAGSSVLLALAAYNSGAGKVKAAVTRNVTDPIQQRNFWYLYRARALPLETREFVPKVFAAILIGRNPKHFGF
jgi:soluble lytic murein transglycosylase-like protein